MGKWTRILRAVTSQLRSVTNMLQWWCSHFKQIDSQTGTSLLLLVFVIGIQFYRSYCCNVFFCSKNGKAWWHDKNSNLLLAPFPQGKQIVGGFFFSFLQYRQFSANLAKSSREHRQAFRILSTTSHLRTMRDRRPWQDQVSLTNILEWIFVIWVPVWVLLFNIWKVLSSHWAAQSIESYNVYIMPLPLPCILCYSSRFRHSSLICLWL